MNKSEKFSEMIERYIGINELRFTSYFTQVADITFSSGNETFPEDIPALERWMLEKPEEKTTRLRFLLLQALHNCHEVAVKQHAQSTNTTHIAALVHNDSNGPRIAKLYGDGIEDVIDMEDPTAWTPEQASAAEACLRVIGDSPQEKLVADAIRKALELWNAGVSVETDGTTH